MDRSEIKEFVRSQPQTTQEVFASLVQSESTTTQKFLIKAVPDSIKRLLIRSGVDVSPVSAWLDLILDLYSTSELMDILTASSYQAKNSFSFKLKRFMFGNCLDSMLGYVTDIDLKNATQDHRLQIGDAMILASLYANCQK
jgi:hypothetical protein